MNHPRLFFAALLALALFVLAPLPACAWPILQTDPPPSGTVNAAANLRAGPGTTYQIVGKAQPGQAVDIFDCDANCEWYQLDSGQWIAAFLVDVDQAHSAAGDGALLVGTWNVESGGADPRVIAARLGEFQDVDLWGLAEVNSAADARLYEAAAEEGEQADYTRILGSTGGGDRLLLLYNEDRFDLVRQGELHAINVRGNVRAPLWAQLEDTYTGEELIFMVNHLYRTDDDARHWQATELNDWAETQTLPIIAVGDYNFDWNARLGEYSHDRGYNNFVADGVWEWVRPDTLTKTQDSSYNSVLDFVFTANAAQDWPAASEIVVVPGDFPNDNTTSDHRPVLATFVLGADPEPVASATPAGRGGFIATAVPSSTPTATAIPTATPLPTATPTTAPTAAPTTAPNLRLGTLNYDGDVPNVESDEFIEIVNGPTEVNLAGWVLRDDDGNVFVFPAYTMAPAARCRVYTDQVYPDHCGFSFGSSQAIWGNSGDMVLLIDPAGQVADRQCWKKGC